MDIRYDVSSKVGVANSKVGVARVRKSRSSSADNVLSTSPQNISKHTNSHFKLRKLNPFSRSTPRLHNVSDSSSQDKMSIDSQSSQDCLKSSVSVNDVFRNESVECVENKPRRKGAIKERGSGRRKSTLATLDKTCAIDKTRHDVRKPRYSLPALTPMDITLARNTKNNYVQNNLLCAFPAKPDDVVSQNSPLCGTPDIGINSTTSPYRSYNEAFSSVPFQNFFSKRVKSNLKRTKSVTKLDRRKMGAPSPNDVSTVSAEPEGSPRFSLKRTMSLGRLGKKLKYKHSHSVATPSAAPEGVIQSSRSHESLLSSPTQLSNLDLSAPDVEIKPLHSSMLGQDHCFQVTTSHGSKYYSCRSAEERQQWIQHLRKTVEPHQEQSRRTDNSVRVWIQEAKNVPSKKRYFCEICLDGTIYARTSTKIAKGDLKSDALFWGEQFEFTNLPRIDVLTINVYREPDKKKKKEKNSLLGYLRLPMSDINGRTMVEKWYPMSSATVGKGASRAELVQIRVRGRYHSVDILPTDMYSSFIEYMERDHSGLVDLLEPVVSVKLKEEIATCMVKILHKRHLACQFLSDIVMHEVLRTEHNSLAFRGNTIATKAMESYMKLVGDKYLKDTLGDFIKHVIECDSDCEVDPSRLQNNSDLQSHQDALQLYCQMAWFKIINSHSHFPREMRCVLNELREMCAKNERHNMSDVLITSFVFLRFLCPAILSPSLFKLCQELPGTISARSLTLTAKTVQNLANFTKFGEKEDYMIFLNEFVERETQSMQNFIAQISSKEEKADSLEFDGFIDMGKELAVLCSLLQDVLPNISEEAKEKVSDLQLIIDTIDTALKEPQNTQSTKCNNLTVYNQLFKATWNSTMQTKGDVTGESITNQINEWSAFAPPMSKYAGNALDNPHRNGTLPRNGKSAPGQDSQIEESSVFSQHDLLSSPKSIDLSGLENKTDSVSTESGAVEFSLGNNTDDLSNCSAVNSPVTAYNPIVSTSEKGATNRETVPPRSGHTQSTPISPVNSANTPMNGNYTSALSDTRLGPSQSTPASRLSEREINSSWGKMVSAAELVNGQGELIDLIRFADQEDDSSEQASTVASSGYQSFTSSASPPQNHHQITTSENQTHITTTENHSHVTTSQNHLPLVPHQGQQLEPLSFKNPLFGQLPSAYVKPKKTVSAENSSQNANGSDLSAKTTSDNVDINMQIRKPNKDISLVDSVHSNKHVSRQVQPPQDLIFAWQRYAAINKSADQGWTNLNTPQSRAPLSSSLPSQMLFSDHVTSPSHHVMQRQPMAAQSPGGMSTTDDYVTLAPPTTSQSCSSTPGDEMPPRLGADGGHKKSTQSTVRMGVSSVHRKVIEHDRHKLECEEELTLLRDQLAETQRMLSDTQQRLLAEEQQRNQVSAEYEKQMKKSQEELNRQQEEKDRELHNLYHKLESHESLRTEQMELQCVVGEKQRIIHAQEQRIRSLDAANNRLLSALGQLKDRYNTNQHNGVKSRDKINLCDTDGLKSSFC